MKIGLLVSLCLAPSIAAAQLPQLTATIPLPEVKGRIDHFGVDVKGNRLFVAALGNNTVEIVDLKAGQRDRSLAGFGEPQGVLHVPETNRVFVANGSADRVDVLDAATLSAVRHIDALADADNVRWDAQARKVWVGWGKGALRALDPASGESAGDIRLQGHPESFQLERRGARIFVNVPTAKQVAVVDRVKRSMIATWDVPAAANFPMALDEAAHRLFVGARKPAVLIVYDTESGKVVARQPIGGDTDDIFFDAQSKRVYVVCGEGRIDVLRQDDPDRYTLEGSVTTAPRARTGLFVPETGTLYVAAPAAQGSPARVLAYRLR
jgi:DNA-binding beta-propeller fold protein YncE